MNKYLTQGLLLCLLFSQLPWRDVAYAHGGTANAHEHWANEDLAKQIRETPVMVKDYDALLAQIKAKGYARVLVQFVIKHTAESMPTQLDEARSELYEVLSGFDYQILRQYYSLPILLLEVDSDALERLRNSPLVNTIHADSLSHTMDKPDQK